MAGARGQHERETDVLGSEQIFPLIDAVRQGDEAAARHLVEAAMEFLHPAVMQMLHQRSASGGYLTDTLSSSAYANERIAEDAWEITHTTCCTMLARLDSFRGRGRLGGTARFSTWLYAIAQNEVRSLLRKRWREQRRRAHPIVRDDTDENTLLEPIAISEEPSAIEQMVEDEQRALVQEGLDQAPLTPAQREAIILFYVMGYKQERIAEMTGVQVGTVKKRVFDGIRKLRAYVEEREAGFAHREEAKES